MHDRRIDDEQRRLARDYAEALGVSGELHDDDFLFWHLLGFYGDADRAVRAYFDGGRFHSNILSRLIRQHKPGVEDLSILDFASGYGRVARFLPRLFPQGRVSACDIHPEAVACLRAMDLEAHLSTSRPEALHLPEAYDVIAVISFFTHLPRERWAQWLATLGAQLKPDGILILTTHGARIWNDMKQPPIEPDGFAFYAYSEQKDLDLGDYGNTITLFDYVASILREGPLQLDAFHAAHFDFQDAYVLRRVEPDLLPPGRREIERALDSRKPFPLRQYKRLKAWLRA